MRSLTAATLALAVLLAGCGGAIQSGPSTTEAAPPTTTATRAPPPTTASTGTPAPTGTSTPTQTAPSTTEAWTPPRPPNTPIENATGNGTASNRITTVRFFGTENGSGYADFDVAVYANTSEAALEGPEEDEPGGQPYLFVWIEGEPVARSEVVSRRNESLTTVAVPGAALRQFDPGSLAVRVALLESDDDGDDRFGTWNGSVEYRP